MGGVLHEHATKAGVEATDVIHAVECTVQGLYLAMLLVGYDSNLLARPLIVSSESVWERWLPHAYVVPEQIVDLVSEVCAFVEFWNRAFVAWGMKKAAKELPKRRSKINSSLGGLVGVGAALAIAEREAE
ncbi:MAG: hypothetical protein WD271_00560 [Acidimicrobiia bacterium]